MNDIKILEEFLEDYIHDGLAIQYRVMEAIENLIQRNKELEEENGIQRHQLNSAFDNGFIHKDLVREKIKKIDEEWHVDYKDFEVKEILQDLLNNKTS